MSAAGGGVWGIGLLDLGGGGVLVVVLAGLLMFFDF